MWLKLCLLLIYITALFILARMLEAIACYETGVLSRRLLDPMTLSVLKLKALLDSRGVSYEGVVEKRELTDLVDRSGQVGEDEMELTVSEVEEDGEETIFTSGSHFFEQVEDAKDSVWLLQIQTRPAASPLSLQTWKAIRKKVNRFGVRAGIFDCSMDVGYCQRKHWLTSRVVLALPQDFETKSNVAFFSYGGAMRESPLYNWVRDRLDSKVTPITNLLQFQRDWLAYQNRFLATEIRAILFQGGQSIPMFFSALSVKFPGRVRFGMVLMNSVCGKEITNEYKWVNGTFDNDQANYLIVTPEMVTKYGRRIGENLSFSRMEKYLNSLYPCLNDLFVFSFVINNLVAWFELVVTQGTLLRRIRRTTSGWIQYNVLFVMLWLPIVGIFQLPYLDQLPLLGLKFIRTMATTDFAALLRNDYIYFSRNLPLLFTSLALYSALVAYLCCHYKVGDNDTEEEEDFWNFAQMRTLQPLLRPSDTIIGPFSRFGSEFIMGEDLYDVPAVPSVDLSYIQELPTWRYCLLPRQCSMPPCQAVVHRQATAGVCKEPGSDRDISNSASCKCEKTASMDGSDEKSNSNLQSLEGNENPTLMSNLASPVACPSCDQPSPARPPFLETTGDASIASRYGLSLATGSPTDAYIHLTTPGTSKEKPVCKCKEKYDSEVVGSVNATQGMKDIDRTTEPGGQMGTHTSGVSTGVLDQLGEGSPQLGAGLSCPNSTGAEKTGAPACFPAGFRTSSQCVICLEEYSPGVMLCGLPCRHAFHQDCIERWLRSDNHLCPICRWPSMPGHQSSTPHLHMD